MSAASSAPSASHRPGPVGDEAGRQPRWLLVLILLPALLVRLPNLDAPVLDRFEFRQTQTAITVQAFLDRGVRVFDYETPLFGPPWRIPFELPLVQLSAFALAKLGRLPLDLSCRTTALVWFGLSAWLLFLIVRRWVGSKLALASLLVYVWTPYSILWSRAFLVDYASVALALGYLYLVLHWLEARDCGSALGAMLVGALAYTVKVMSLPGVLVVMAGAGVSALSSAWRPPARGGARWKARLGLLVWLFLLAAVPLAAGLAWTRYTDQMKAAIPATAWAVSTNLYVWNFGTLAQRLSWANWAILLQRIGDTLLPGLLVLSIPLAFVSLRRGDARLRLALLAAPVGVVAPILIFFPLYVVHDFYLAAITPFLSVATGAGLLYLIALRLPGEAMLTLAAVTTLLAARGSWEYVRPTFAVSAEDPIARLGRLVAAQTTPEQWVAVEGDEWSSRVLYSARRRGYMMWFHTPAQAIAHRPELGALVCRECGPKLLALWPRRRFVGHEGGFDVFRVWTASAGGAAPIEGQVEGADCARLKGWAWDPARPRLTLVLELAADGRPIQRLKADIEREVLLTAGKGDGRHGFRLPLPEALRDGRAHALSIRVADTGVLLNGSPSTIVCPAARDLN